MKWIGRRESSNVEDRRGLSGGKIATGGGIAGLVIYLLYTFLSGNNVDPSELQRQLTNPDNQTSQLTPEEQKKDNERTSFVKVVLAETEDVWKKIFSEKGQQYSEPTLVLFRQLVESACGNASAASGPFYCPGDRKLYIDISFYQDLQEKLKAPGDFPMAYVVAHEVGHHVQNLMGTADKINRLRQQLTEKQFNKYSVMMELQADFFAGVWAHYTEKKDILDAGDINEAIVAASAIGDDRLQKEATGRVVPDAFTHGTSTQRIFWFKKGFETGDLKQGDTFNDPSLR